ncbi:saccharopine dehydrogenase NADP-binding domain-containing protein [Pontixanthobacter luteolus]|uniref:saccharopine dehydrogenase NADP-binding domain-containing protein n=1 Tax=Pontixanthobacter luteolus TaxID=295089 RepID=UPI0023040CC9|nr:saccharopine dehydrogenase NADP-binding domain-containing protein [Pontixanthobacter luteolus]
MSEMPKSLRVLIIGGSGVFGSRLAELAAQEPGVSLTLAGRNVDRLGKIANALVPQPSVLRLDRDLIEPGDLEPFDLVIDAAGPFQASRPQVIAAALGSGTPYVDLADGRRFVADFPSFDDAAKRCGVPLITGASSIPALSHAVLDRMVSRWSVVEDIRIGIFPGNRAPRGLSVVQAILSYVGKPVKAFREGEWQQVPGWGLTHSEQIPGGGKRWASVCDTPEQDLLVQRYRPRRSAEFFAGLELGLLHHGLAMLSMPVRWGWIASLRPFSKAMLAAAKLFLPFGSDKGAMIVSASGEDQMGRPINARWSLAASGNRGPFVPVLAALCMIRRFRDGWPPEPGAHVCAGLLCLSEFEDDMAKLGIVHRFEETHGKPADVLTGGAKAA